MTDKAYDEAYEEGYDQALNDVLPDLEAALCGEMDDSISYAYREGIKAALRLVRAAMALHNVASVTDEMKETP